MFCCPYAQHILSSSGHSYYPHRSSHDIRRFPHTRFSLRLGWIRLSSHQCSIRSILGETIRCLWSETYHPHRKFHLSWWQHSLCCQYQRSYACWWTSGTGFRRRWCGCACLCLRCRHVQHQVRFLNSFVRRFAFCVTVVRWFRHGATQG